MSFNWNFSYGKLSDSFKMNNLTTAAVCSQQDRIWGRHQFVLESPGLAIPSIIVLFIASVVGTLGNVLVITAVATQKPLWNRESIFIVNLALSDLYVTVVADPMGIVAKLEGERFFDEVPGLCRVVASLCTISCIASLGSIACLSFNRYIHICHNHLYDRIFTRRSCIMICVCLYFIGICMVLLNLADIGDHSFDRKSLECIWDRMATFPYTVVFSVTLVWIPVLVTGSSYISLYLFVRNSQKRVQQHRLRVTVSTTNTESDNVEMQSDHGVSKEENSGIENRNAFHRELNSRRTAIKIKTSMRKSLHLARTIFVVYAVFSTCWIPFAILMVVDTHNTFSHGIHLFITVFAHLHPSINWLVYYKTNKKFATAFDNLVSMKKYVYCCRPLAY